jgi:glycosyltransferase involved in cell wall biosynthesis
VRICLIYDCLYPWTVGGGERWMRGLAEALAAAGHEVTYLTRKQWPDSEPPAIPGVRVVAVSREEPLYGPDGNRTIGEPLRFGWGVLRHLLRHRGAYDVVHATSFPYFSLLAAGGALAGTRTSLVVDWFEVWSRTYWRRYLGGPKGWVGWAVQRLCARVPQRAFVFSRLHGRRLVEEGLRGEPRVHAGLYAGPLEPPPRAAEPRAPLVVFAGRHIAEKRVPAIPAAIAAARQRLPELRALILGDGPQLPDVRAAIDAAGVADVVEAAGFVDSAVVRQSLADASCLLLPSEREGYGLIVVEAAAVGTPSIVVAGEDNAAVELIAEGVNGVVAASTSPHDLAEAIVRLHAAPGGLRDSTLSWFAENRRRLSLQDSLATVLASYEPDSARS